MTPWRMNLGHFLWATYQKHVAEKRWVLTFTQYVFPGWVKAWIAKPMKCLHCKHCSKALCLTNVSAYCLHDTCRDIVQNQPMTASWLNNKNSWILSWEIWMDLHPWRSLESNKKSLLESKPRWQLPCISRWPFDCHRTMKECKRFLKEWNPSACMLSSPHIHWQTVSKSISGHAVLYAPFKLTDAKIMARVPLVVCASIKVAKDACPERNQ